jgi:hypothetical protein
LIREKSKKAKKEDKQDREDQRKKAALMVAALIVTAGVSSEVS